MTRLRLGICLALLALTALATPAMASAHDTRWKDPSTGYVLHQHRTTLYYWLQGVPSLRVRDQARIAIERWDSATHVNLVETSDSAKANIQVFAAHYGNTQWAGMSTGCYHCNAVSAKLNLTYLDTYPLDWVRAVACHESGHALGLYHADGDCMGFGTGSFTSYPSGHSIYWTNRTVDAHFISSSPAPVPQAGLTATPALAVPGPYVRPLDGGGGVWPRAR